MTDLTLDGPSHGPHGGGQPGHLVILLHGYGPNGADLTSLAPYWQKALPGAAFAAPNALEPIPGMRGAPQW